jgi:TRAP-type C4-dicarboxylate transport system permease small subunit
LEELAEESTIWKALKMKIREILEMLACFAVFAFIGVLLAWRGWKWNFKH